MKLFMFFACNVCLASWSSCEEDSRGSRDLIRSLLMDYDANTPPQQDEPIAVTASLYLNSLMLKCVRELSSEFRVEADMYFLMSWNDPRLTFDPSTYGVDEVIVSGYVIQFLWTPDLFFRHGRRLAFKEVPTDESYLRITPNGDILLGRSVYGEIGSGQPCQNAAMYPFSFILESYKYPSDKLTVAYGDFQFNYNLSIDNYSIEDIVTKNCTLTYNSGTFSCAEKQVFFTTNTL